MAENRVFRLQERSIPDRIRWLVDKLDREGEDEFMRFAVASALLGVAADLESPRLAQVDGEPCPTCGHNPAWAEHSDGDAAQ